MELVKKLIKENYALFNIGASGKYAKAPINKQGNPMDKWENKTCQELKEEHNYNSLFWGMRMGIQENGKRIMSLDFDCCGKENKEKTARVGCQYTKEKLKTFEELIDIRNGMFTSSTQGNMNVLIDYTDCEHIIKLVEQISANKFKLEEFEILLGGNQVIPPSATTCKITKQKGNARSFYTEEPFYHLTEESTIYDFVKELFDEHLQKNNKNKTYMKTQKPIKDISKAEDETDDEITSTTSSKDFSKDKWVILLNKYIGNGRDEEGCKIISRDYWFQICGALKSNGYDKQVWLDWSSKISQTNTASKTWDNLKKFDMNINCLRSICKDVNKKGYYEWLNEYDVCLYRHFYTTGLIADYFKLLYEDRFVCVDNVVYSYNGFIWEKEDKKNSNLAKFIDKVFYKDLLQYCNTKSNYFTSLLNENEEDEDIKNTLEKITKLQMNINYLRGVTARKQLMDDIITFLTRNDIKLDNNPFLFAFDNCIYDLKTGTFIEPKYDYWITKTAGYNYVKSTPQQIKELDDIINTIFPDPDVKKDYLITLATGLCGIQLQNLFIATGGGGNGKSLINSLMLKAVGKYGYKLPSNVLLQEIKSGANPEMALLDNVRFALVQEPNAEKKIKCSTVKEITGDTTLNVRDHYSSKCDINLSLTLVMECNDKPKLDEVNDAVNRRIRASVFGSKFVPQDIYDDLDKEQRVNVFISNPYYVSDPFREKYKCVLFDILTKYFKMFQENNYILGAMPFACKKVCVDYMATSDNIYGWFSGFYKKTAKIEESKPILLSELFNVFESSSYYNNMSKADKRTYNKKHFIDKIETNLFLQKYLKKRDTTFNKQKMKNPYIVGWEKNENEEDDEEGVTGL